jgi:hypothetical protein
MLPSKEMRLALWRGVVTIIESNDRWLDFLQNEGQLKVLAVKRGPEGLDLVDDPLHPDATEWSLQGAVIRVLTHPQGSLKANLFSGPRPTDASTILIGAANDLIDSELRPIFEELYPSNHNLPDPPHGFALEVVKECIKRLEADGATTDDTFNYTTPIPREVRVVVPIIQPPAPQGIRVPTVGGAAGAPTTEVKVVAPDAAPAAGSSPTLVPQPPKPGGGGLRIAKPA